MKKTGCIFVNGDLKDKKFYKDIIADCEIVVAADGAANSLKDLEIIPDIIIGDMDSIDDQVYSYYENKNVAMLKYPVKKDKTDTELAIDELEIRGYRDALMMGFAGGRIDHMLGNLGMCSYADAVGIDLTLRDENTAIFLAQKGKTIIKAAKNSIISFISYAGSVYIKKLTGFEYPLEDYILMPGSTRCISNAAVQDDPVLEIESGCALVIINF